MDFSPETQALFTSTIAKYPHKQAAMLPCLWIVQNERGHISLEAMEHIASLLEVNVSAVYSAVGFYSMYQTKPVGKHHIQVCRTLSCELAGAQEIIAYLQQKLKIGLGETTPDGLFTLNAVECLASCGTGPMCQINKAFYENLTPEAVDELLNRLVEEGNT